jgi:hypothetical protein
VDNQIIEDRVDAARTEFELAKNSRDRNRTEADRQRDATRKLEDFKLEVAKAAGEIQKKYGEAYGKLQEAYAESNAKILQSGGEAAGKAIEDAARRAAETLAGAMDGSGAAGVGAGAAGGLAEAIDRIKGAYSFRGISQQAYKQPGDYQSSTKENFFFNFGNSDLINKAKARIASLSDKDKAALVFTAITEYGGTSKGLSEVGANLLVRSASQGNRAIADIAKAPGQYEGVFGYSKETLQSQALGRQYLGAARYDSAYSALFGGAVGAGPARVSGTRETGAGYRPRGMSDASGRPVVMSKEAAVAFEQMVAASKGIIRGSDIASSQRSAEKNAAVGGAAGSKHLSGMALDIHGASMEWIRANGAKYGFRFNDYPGSHGGHLEYSGGAGMGAAGVPSPAAIRQPLALGPRVDPNDPRFRVDLSGTTSKIEASNAANTAQVADNIAAARASELKGIYDEQIAAIKEITSARQAAAQAGKEQYEDEIKAFELMRDGVTPELAKQFVEIDRAAQVERTRLQNKRDEYAAQASNAALEADVRINAAKITAEYDRQLAAQAGITAQLRNQAVQQQQLKQNPGMIIQDRLSFLKEDEKKLTNLGNQAVFVANSIGDSFEQAFTGVITGTKTAQEALAGFFESIASDFAKMAAQILANQLQQAILKGLGGLLGVPALPSANGNAFASNGIQKFARGGIVDSPTLFRFAKGGSMKMGVAGEAGPEAILPLSRGAGGKLGVRLEVPKRPSTRSASSAAAEAEAMATSKPIKIEYESRVINGETYVTQAQFESGLRGAVGQAQQATAKSMRTSLRYRRSAGLG